MITFQQFDETMGYKALVQTFGAESMEYMGHHIDFFMFNIIMPIWQFSVWLKAISFLIALFIDYSPEHGRLLLKKNSHQLSEGQNFLLMLLIGFVDMVYHIIGFDKPLQKAMAKSEERPIGAASCLLRYGTEPATSWAHMCLVIVYALPLIALLIPKMELRELVILSLYFAADTFMNIFVFICQRVFKRINTKVYAADNQEETVILVR